MRGSVVVFWFYNLYFRAPDWLSGAIGLRGGDFVFVVFSRRLGGHVQQLDGARYSKYSPYAGLGQVVAARISHRKDIARRLGGHIRRRDGGGYRESSPYAFSGNICLWNFVM